VKLIRDLSISIKVLIAPVILIIALGVVTYLSIYGLNAQRSMLGTVQSIALERFTLLDEFTVLSEQVQSNLFRVSVLRFMDVPEQEIQPIVDQLEQGLNDLDIIYGQILNKWSLDESEQDMLDRMREPMTAFSQQAEQATAVAADNPSFGILLVRSSTVPFAQFQDALSEFRDYQQARIVRAETESARMVSVARTIIISIALVIAFVSTLSTLLISTHLISRPIGAMTTLMRRLAEGELSIEVNNIDRRDEIGAMARAVQVFRDNANERERLDEALRESENLLDSILQVVPVGICLTDEQGRYVLVNDAYCRTYEFATEEIIGQHFGAIMPPDQLALAEAHYARLLSGDMGIPSIRKRQRHDGSIIWIEAANALLVREDGTKLVITTVRDITERQEASEALRESQERLQDLYDNAPSAYFSVDTDGLIRRCNKRAEELLGYTVEELVGRPVLDLYADTPEGKDMAVTMFERFLAGQTIVDQELQMQRADGRLIWIGLTVNIVRDAQGRVMESRSMAIDISERKRAEAEIESLARFPSENPNPVLRIAHDGIILYANRGSQPLLEGWGCQVEQCLPDEWHQVIQDALHFGQSQEAEVEHAERVLSLTFAPVPAADYVNVYGLDVTERRRTEEAVIQASRLEATATLASGIAHRVNNLMVGVLGYAELLKDSLADHHPDETDMLTTISRSAEQAGDLALQMLTFARGARYQPQPLNLNDVVQAVLGAQSHSLPAEISVELHTGTDLWDVAADPIQINQAFLNLFENAVEAIEGRGRITIATRNIMLDTEQAGLSAGPHVCLSIQDTGCGMSTDTQAKIFEPFFTTKFEGRGLGLAAAHGIVKNHGGQITVESKQGRGSTFAIYLAARQQE
jgi:PAS domain S-box-containing protein